MERTISARSDRNVWDYLWRFANFGQSDRNVPFHLTKLMCPVPLFCFLLTRTRIKRAVAWVWTLHPECTVPMSTWNFRNFKPEYFVEWKAPIVYNNLKMCLSSITIINLCTASFQAFSVSAFRWRIQDARTTWPETHRPRDRWKSKKKIIVHIQSIKFIYKGPQSGSSIP